MFLTYVRYNFNPVTYLFYIIHQDPALMTILSPIRDYCPPLELMPNIGFIFWNFM